MKTNYDIQYMEHWLDQLTKAAYATTRVRDPEQLGHWKMKQPTESTPSIESSNTFLLLMVALIGGT